VVISDGVIVQKYILLMREVALLAMFKILPKWKYMEVLGKSKLYRAMVSALVPNLQDHVCGQTDFIGAVRDRRYIIFITIGHQLAGYEHLKDWSNWEAGVELG
jgi:hypothetical protein